MEQSGGGGDWRLVPAPELFSDTEMETAGDDDVDEGADDQEETSKLTPVKPQPTVWTDEKHNLYLKSIEASFVDQLYNSMGFPGFEPPRKASHETKPHLRSSSRTSAGQFKTLRGGHWHKINFGKGEHEPDGQNASHGLLSNQWIRHYRHSERRHLLESANCPGKSAAIDQEINSRGTAALPHKFTSSLKISNEAPSNLHRPVFAYSDAEASGQNFVSEDIAGEKLSIFCATE
uniref:Uncharacterized protein n=1 Tax=Kalanchoe fedtschenkoi TaxID=63787 RepID=A0A7N0ZVR2_KALFE